MLFVALLREHAPLRLKFVKVQHATDSCSARLVAEVFSVRDQSWLAKRMAECGVAVPDTRRDALLASVLRQAFRNAPKDSPAAELKMSPAEARAAKKRVTEGVTAHWANVRAQLTKAL